MIESFKHLQPGTLPGWGTFVAALVALGIWWIRGAPDRRRAANEAQIIEGTEMDRVITEMREQIKEYRAEVHKYRNEVQALQGELMAANRLSSQRSDRIDTLQIIVELLLSELERIDPESPIVRQAKIMLRRTMDASDPMQAAKDTVKAAQDTVEKLKGEGE